MRSATCDSRISARWRSAASRNFAMMTTMAKISAMRRTTRTKGGISRLDAVSAEPVQEKLIQAQRGFHQTEELPSSPPPTSDRSMFEA